jgi:hypothetical protein
MIAKAATLTLSVAKGRGALRTLRVTTREGLHLSRKVECG